MPDNFFVNLTGKWALSRSISTGENFHGSATFDLENKNQLVLFEQGSLFLSESNVIDATRRWVWRLAESSQLNIFFDESPLRLYHQLELVIESNRATGTANHVCGDDIYAGKYQISETSIKIHQTVSGPKKDYSILSKYDR